MEGELEEIKKLNEEKEKKQISEIEYNEKVCEYFCNAAESSSLSSLLFLSSLLPSQLFLNYRSTKTGEKGWNAILYASKGASIEVMEFLLSFGFDINSLNSYEENCLFIAIKNGKSKEYIEYLFSKAANFSQKDRNGCNLCTILLRDGKYNFDDKDVLEILKYLVEERAVDIHHKNMFRERAIQFATSHNVEIMKYLVSHNSNREYIIHLAIKANNMEVIEYLISLNVNLDYITDEGFTLFLYAAVYSNLKVIQYLVSLNRFDIHYQLLLDEVNNEKSNAIGLAAPSNSLEVIQYLVSLGIDFQYSYYGKNAFFWCAKSLKNIWWSIDSSEKNHPFLNMKYLASIGIDTYQNNQSNSEIRNKIIDYLLREGKMEEIEFIHSLYHSCEFDKYKNLLSFSKSKYFYDINLLKYLIENNIIEENYPNNNQNKRLNHGSILHILIKCLSTLYTSSLKLSTKEKFKRFKECFNYFLERGNDINSIQSTKCKIPLFNIVTSFTLPFSRIDRRLAWMISKYLIDKGSNLLHISEKRNILHIFFEYYYGKVYYQNNIIVDKLVNKEIVDIMKYIIIRSVEINEKSSTQSSIIQYIQLSTFQNNKENSLLIKNYKNNNSNDINNNNIINDDNDDGDDEDICSAKEMKEGWKLLFFTFVLSPPLILSFHYDFVQKPFAVNDNGELILK